MNPAIRKALVKAINCTFASLPQDVREELRGCWFWQIAPLRHQERLHERLHDSTHGHEQRRHLRSGFC